MTYIMHALNAGLKVDTSGTTVEEASEIDPAGAGLSRRMIKEVKMIRDITIGQYYPADSVLHRLDPRVQIYRDARLYRLAVRFIRSWGYASGTVFLAAMILLSKVPFSFMVKGLKAICDPAVSPWSS